MHLTDSEKAAAESWGPALLFQPSAQLFFKPSFNLTQLLLFLSLLVRNRWQIPLYHQAPESVTHYIKVGGSSVVLLWSFCCVLLRIFFTIMCGCIWTDSRNGMGCVLEMIAERKQRAPHTPFLREKITGRAVIWHLTFPSYLETVNIPSGSCLKTGCLGALWFQEESVLLSVLKKYWIFEESWIIKWHKKWLKKPPKQTEKVWQHKYVTIQ